MRLPLETEWKEILVVVVAAVVGVVLLVGATAILGSSYASTALVNGGPGSTPSKPLDVSTDQLNRYIDTELIYITVLNPQIEENITKDTGVVDPPKMTATQDGNTNIIKMTVVGSSPQEAAAMANSAANTYITDWNARHGAEVISDQSATKKQLADVQIQLATLKKDGSCAKTNTSLCEELRALESAYKLSLRPADRFVQEPTADTAVKTTSNLAVALLGAILGLVIGVLIVYLQRRRQDTDRRTNASSSTA